MQSIKNEKTSNRVLFRVSIILVAFMLCATVLGLLFFRQAISKNKKAIAIEGEEQYDKHFVLITNNRGSAFWKEIYQGALEKAQENNAYVEIMGDNLSVKYNKNELIKIAIEAKVDGILLEADESVATRTMIDEAEQAGIPVVTVLSDSKRSKRQSFVGISSYDLGAKYGEQVANVVDQYYGINQEKVDHTKKSTQRALVLMNSNAQETGQNILFTGIDEMVKKQSPNSDKVVLDTALIKNDAAFAAEESIRDILHDRESQPDIIICLDELSTTCVYQTLVDYNRVGEITVIGYYNSDMILHAIEQNVVHSTIIVNTKQIGEYSIEALQEYVRTGYVSEYFSVDTSIISQDNVKNYLKEGNVENNN